MRTLTAAFCILHIKPSGITYRDGTLDDHHSFGIDFQYKVDDFFYMTGVKIVFDGVVIGGCCYDYKVGILIGGDSIKGGYKRRTAFGTWSTYIGKESGVGQILLYVLVLNGGDTGIDLVYLLGDDIYGSHLMVLCQQSSNAESDIAGTCYSYLKVLKLAHRVIVLGLPAGLYPSCRGCVLLLGFLGDFYIVFLKFGVLALEFGNYLLHEFYHLGYLYCT